MKKRRTQEAWFELVEGYKHSEMTIDDYCESNQISQASYYKYRRIQKLMSPSFLPVVFQKPTSASLVFESNGFKLKLMKTFLLNIFTNSWGPRRMILNLDQVNGIYMAVGPTDLRKGIDGYSAVVASLMKLNPFEKNLYLFCNRNKDKMKILYWDGNGFWLFYKRLESSQFRWLKENGEVALNLIFQQFRWLLEGLDIHQKNAF